MWVMYRRHSEGCSLALGDRDEEAGKLNVKKESIWYGEIMGLKTSSKGNLARLRIWEQMVESVDWSAQ